MVAAGSIDLYHLGELAAAGALGPAAPLSLPTVTQDAGLRVLHTDTGCPVYRAAAAAGAQQTATDTTTGALAALLDRLHVFLEACEACPVPTAWLGAHANRDALAVADWLCTARLTRRGDPDMPVLRRARWQLRDLVLLADAAALPPYPPTAAAVAAAVAALTKSLHGYRLPELQMRLLLVLDDVDARADGAQRRQAADLTGTSAATLVAALGQFDRVRHGLAAPDSLEPYAHLLTPRSWVTAGDTGTGHAVAAALADHDQRLDPPTPHGHTRLYRVPALWALVHGGAARRWVALLGHDAGYAPAQVAAAAALGATPSTLPALITAVDAANQSLR